MTRYVRDDNGNMHAFDDSVSDQEVVNTLDKAQQIQSQPAGPPQPEVAGSTPGGLEPNPKAPDAPLIPLSRAARQAQQYGLMGSLSNNRPMVMYGNDMYNVDPSVAARKAQGTEAGKQAQQLAGRREAGTRIIPGIEQLRDLVNNQVDDDTWGRAFGMYNNTKMRPEVEFPLHPMAYRAPDMTPTQARVMFGDGFIGNDPKDPKNIKAADAQNAGEHLTAALTDQYIASAGGAAVVNSDARMGIFKDMMDKVLYASNRTEANKILDTAEDAARNVFALSAREGSHFNPVKVKTTTEAAALRPNTYYMTPDGQIVRR